MRRQCKILRLLRLRDISPKLLNPTIAKGQAYDPILRALSRREESRPAMMTTQLMDLWKMSIGWPLLHFDGGAFVAENENGVQSSLRDAAAM